MADQSLDRVQRFTNVGVFVGKVGGAGGGSTPVQFENPVDIATTSAGDVFVADGFRVVVLASDLGLRTTFGQGELFNLESIAVGAAGVYTLDESSTFPGFGRRLTRWSNTATPVKQAERRIPDSELGASVNGADMAVDTAGNVYVTDGTSRDVAVFDSSFALVRHVGAFSLPPRAIAVGVVGGAAHLYVGGDGIRRLSTLGDVLSPSCIMCGSGDDVSVDSAGNVFSTTSSVLFRVDTTPDPAVHVSPAPPQTSQTVTFDASTSRVDLWAVQRLEWDLNGDGTYETDAASNPTITHRFDQEGPVSVGLRMTGSNGRVATRQVSIAVGRSRAALVATPSVALTGQPVTFDAGGSALPAASIAAVASDIDGNGTFETDTGAQLSVRHAFSATGAARVAVRVTRGGGVVDTASLELEVRPAPPSGRVGVSVNRAAKYTNNPAVTISLVWPALASTATISNDGGFRDARTVPLGAQVPWRLLRTGAERLPKTIYVRFDGNDRSTYQDDIILDQTAPEVRAARVRGPAKGRRTLTLQARDNASGVTSAQIRIRARVFAVKYQRQIRLARRTGKVSVRVRDGAGNYSRWRTAKGTKGS